MEDKIERSVNKIYEKLSPKSSILNLNSVQAMKLATFHENLKNFSKSEALISKLLNRSIKESDRSSKFIQNVLKTCVQLNLKGKLRHYSGTVEDKSEKEIDIFILHMTNDSDIFKFNRQSKKDPSCGILYRGFSFRLFEEQLGGKNQIGATVFTNFYPKFDNADDSSPDKIMNELWPKDNTIQIDCGSMKKFKFANYMYATMICRDLVGMIFEGRNPPEMSESFKREWVQRCVKKMGKWGLCEVQKEMYLFRINGWFEYVKEKREMRESLTSFYFLEQFSEFLSDENRWNEKGQRKVEKSWPIFFIAGGKADMKFAQSLADKIKVSIEIGLEDSKIRKSGKRTKHFELETDCFRGTITVLNPSSEKGSSGGRESLENAGTKKSKKKQNQLKQSALFSQKNSMKQLNSLPRCSFLILELEDFKKVWKDDAEKCLSTLSCQVLDVGSENVAEKILKGENGMVRPWLIVPFGFIGCGKSCIGKFLGEKINVKVIRSEENLPPNKKNRLVEGRKIGPKEFSEIMRKSMEPTYATSEDQNSFHIPPIVYRDKNLPLDSKQIKAALACAAPQFSLALVFGTTSDDFGGEVECDLDAVPPISYWEIAVCLRRVLSRENHPTIDPNTNKSLQVFCQFCNRLYRGCFGDSFEAFHKKSNSNFEGFSRSDWLNAVSSYFGGNVVGIPLCRDLQFTTRMPKDLKNLLLIGLKIYRAGIKDAETAFEQLFPKYFNEDFMRRRKDCQSFESFWAEHLKLEIAENRELIKEIGFDWDDRDFMSILEERLKKVQKIVKIRQPSAPENSPKTEMAPVHQNHSRPVSYYAVHCSSDDLFGCIGKTRANFCRKLIGKKFAMKLDKRKELHVTLAYLKDKPNCRKSAAVKKIKGFVGRQVEVRICGMACDGKAAAFVAEGVYFVESDGAVEKVPCLNKLPHLTLAVNGASNRYSNDMLESGMYEYVEVKGVVKGIVRANMY